MKISDNSRYKSVLGSMAAAAFQFWLARFISLTNYCGTAQHQNKNTTKNKN
jgi:hypothetical protein